MKQLLGNPLVQFLIGRTIGVYMLFVGVTTRWERVNRAAGEPFMAPGGGRVVLCAWHGRFALFHKLWSFKRGAPKAQMLVSHSREGGIVAHTAQAVGSSVIRGSSSKGRQDKGALEATRAMARHLKSGGMVGMTPDGPSGPRMHAKKGPVQLAKLAAAPLLPVAWATAKRNVVEKSWDHFVFPLPFGRGALVWGNPIAPPPPGASDAEIEAVRLALENELNRVSAEADRLAGVPVIEPAPLVRGDTAMAEAAE